MFWLAKQTLLSLTAMEVDWKKENKKSDVNGYFLMWLAIEFEWNIDKIIWISFVGNNG